MKGTSLVLGFVVVAALSQPGHAGKDFDKLVKVTASASKIGADGKQKVAFTFAIEKGWYIYANPVGDKQYEENHTTIEFSGTSNVKGLVQYPNANGTNKDKHKIYENAIVIKSEVQRSVGDTKPVEAKIVINVCSHAGLCLPTRTIKLTIP